jgi:predicted dehydrogenase
VKRTVNAARTATALGRHFGKVRIGVVGAGVFGGYHAQKYASTPHAQFVGVFDLNTAAAAKVVGKVGKGLVFASFEALAAECDALVIATPAVTHAKLARMALDAGKHALVEKPLALTGHEARALAGLALERNLVLQVGHQERLVFQAMGLFATGERPLRIEGSRVGPPAADHRCEDVSAIFDLMIHDLDLAAELFGTEVKSVYGRGRMIHTDKIDESIALVKFGNGGEAKLTASRAQQQRMRKMRIDYPSGTVEIDFLTRQVKNTTPFNIRADVSEILPDPLRAADEAFLAAIQGRDVSPVTGGVGARAAAMAELVEKSAQRRRPTQAASVSAAAAA